MAADQLDDLLDLQVRMLGLLKPSLWKADEFPVEFAARCGVLFEQSLKLLDKPQAREVVQGHIEELRDMDVLL